MKTQKNITGILLLNKPVGLSSNLALQKVKKIFNAKKAGHTGSLDPLAQGMLPICFGEATKFSNYILNASKKYRAQVKLGVISSTGDSEGEKTTIKTMSSPLAVETINAAINAFIGLIDQIPPMYSAIKQNGQPLYKLARQGLVVPRAKRKVQIYSIKLADYSVDTLQLDIECSKGTYIRTLVEDIGKKLKTGAYMTSLFRSDIGNFKEEEMISLSDLQKLSVDRCAETELSSYLLPVEIAVESLPSLIVDKKIAQKMVFGQNVLINDAVHYGRIKIILEDGGEFIGIGDLASDGTLSPKRLMQHNSIS